ncbi:hypothetical protein D5F01_LYC22293 [Larimichthys crocea]|uniref:Tyr recombinase domain-containing protein n=1 Tax=Larimichthys crocea TaxID=215358 RepID=A0A6G0HM91_LARCR|nr:hypothetical protein D5F01_LYC22293 [Larimichthys crocea]
MEETLALNASDSDLLEEISNTPEVSETSPSPVIPAGQPPRPRSVVQIRRRLRSSISDSSNAIGPSPPHRPRGRTRRLQTLLSNPLPIQTRRRPAEPPRGDFTRATRQRPHFSVIFETFYTTPRAKHHFRVAVAVATTMTSRHRLRLSPLIQPLPRASSPLSPHEPVLNYINSRLACQASPLDPPFISETGRVAARSWFQRHFRQILLRSGIPPEPYSGHSFRIGAASTASGRGIPDNITKILGHWASTAYLAYSRRETVPPLRVSIPQVPSRIPPVNHGTTLPMVPPHPSFPSSLIPLAFPPLTPSSLPSSLILRPPSLHPSSPSPLLPSPLIPSSLILRPPSLHPSNPLTLSFPKPSHSLPPTLPERHL